MDCPIRALIRLGGVPRKSFYRQCEARGHLPTEQTPRLHHRVRQLCPPLRVSSTPVPPYAPWVKGKAERPIQYLRERFWRGYPYRSREKAKSDVQEWLAETVHALIHCTYWQPVGERWEEEKAFLANLPAAYDTSLTIFRPVSKECQLSYNGNRYLVSHHGAGKKVMLKIKGKTIRIYHDQKLLATYQEPEEKHTLVGDPAIYRTLVKDRLQANLKYGSKKARPREVLPREPSSLRWRYGPLRNTSVSRGVRHGGTGLRTAQGKPHEAEALPDARNP